MTNKERYENLIALGDFCLALANREGNRIRDGEENAVIEAGFYRAVQSAALAYGAAETYENKPG